MRPFGRPWWRCEDNKDVKEIEWEYVDWVNVAQDRDQLRDLVNMVLNVRVP
jgi:hypothetical protein